ncbi:MAG: type II toxin-antitoxin system HicA family toxin [Bacteroidia bacterium]|nr:type II toxin-antitoxin system HicA family toxin [Bacteroidia bacterium]
MLKVKQLIRILENEGWVEVRSKGGHRFFRNPSKNGFLVVPHHGSRDLSKGLVIKF